METKMESEMQTGMEVRLAEDQGSPFEGFYKKDHGILASRIPRHNHMRI